MRKYMLTQMAAALLSGCMTTGGSATLSPVLRMGMRSLTACGEARDQVVEGCIDALKAHCVKPSSQCAQSVLTSEPACTTTAAQACMRALQAGIDFNREPACATDAAQKCQVAQAGLGDAADAEACNQPDAQTCMPYMNKQDYWDSRCMSEIKTSDPVCRDATTQYNDVSHITQ